jgi:hypothetical protein
MTNLSLLSLLPTLLPRIVSITPEALWRRRSSTRGFALVEQAWHLADLECDAYAVRIERLLAEENPSFADFEGERIAIERRYLERELRPALERYVATREANRQRLLRVQPEEWQRRGTQEKVGEITLARVAASMLEHDRAHANELVALLPELGVPVPAELLAFAAEEPLARSA